VVFSSRMNQPFELSPFSRATPSAPIRIIDMVGRRGRYITIGLACSVGSQLHRWEPHPKTFVTRSSPDSSSRSSLPGSAAAYYSDGFLGKVVLGRNRA